MDYFDLARVNGRALMLFGVVVLLTIYFYRHAGRRWFPPVFFVVALVAAASHTGVLRPSAWRDLERAATGKLDAAAVRASAIGNAAHSTSAGSAGTSNQAYDKRMKRGN